jgi:hypothetical protein
LFPPTAFLELTKHERRRLIAISVIRTVVTTGLLLVIYVLAPAEGFTSTEAIIRLVLVLAIVIAVILFQIGAIKSASYPNARAIEAVIIAVTVFIVLFALFYLGLANAEIASFNQPLDRVSAFYFTVTTLATVGYGDIAPKSDVARIVVIIQMLLDLTLIAIVVRVFFSVAKSSSNRE